LASTDDLNPQAREMADESMVRTLAAQAEAIWPQEKPLFERYRLPADASVMDAGCGTGEITDRLAQTFPHARVTKRGGWVHLIAEDYLMINFEPRRLDPDDFWLEGPRRFGSATGTNMRIGRGAYGILRRLGLANISVDYVVVDPLRVPRDTFAAIWKAWRDGYADAVSTHTSISREMFLAHFEDMIATIEDLNGYGVWHVPVIAAQVA
jgi:hypothetical protein